MPEVRRVSEQLEGARRQVTGTQGSSVLARGRNAKALDRELNKIINAPNVSADSKKYAQQLADYDKSTNRKGSGRLIERGVMKALDVVDTPRAFAVSGVGELFDGFTELVNAPGHEYTRMSWDELWKGTKENRGFGDVIYEQFRAGALAGDNELFGLQIFSDDELKKLKDDPDNYRPKLEGAPRAIGVAGGLVGDVALDPLTYVAGEAKLAQLGGYRGVARTLMETADNPEALRLGQKILRDRAVTTLSKAELQAVNDITGAGLRGGVFLNVPGTGRVAQRLGRKGGVQQIRIGGQEAANFMPGAVAKRALGASKSTMPVAAIRSALGGDVSGLWQKIAAGTPQEAHDAWWALDELTERRTKAKAIADQVEHQFVRVRDEADKAFRGTDLDHGVEIQRLLDMDDAARAADPGFQRMEQLAPGLLSRVQALNEFARTQFNELGESEWIQRFDYWRPSITTEDWKALLVDLGRKPGKGGGTNPAWFERAALRPGDEFLGELIVEPAEAGAGIHEQMLKIVQSKAEEVGWRTVEHMFEPDYWKAMQAYSRSAEHRAVMVAVEGRLAKRGIAVDRFKLVEDKAAKQTLAKRRRAVKAVWDARLAEKRKRAVLQQAEQDLADAQAVETAVAAGGASAKASAKKAVDGAGRQVEQAVDTARYTMLAAEGAELESRRVSAGAVRRTLEALDAFDARVAPVLGDARKALADSAEEIENLYGARQTLLQQRDDALRKLAVAEEASEERLAKARLSKETIANAHDEINRIEDVVAALDAKIAARGLDANHAERVAKLTTQVQKNDTVVRMVEDFLSKATLPPTVTGLTADDMAALARKLGRDWPKDVAGRKAVLADLRNFLDTKARPLVETQKESLRQLKLTEKVHGDSLKGILGQREDALRTLDGVRGTLDQAAKDLAGDPVAMRYVELEQNLAKADASGYLLNPNDDLGGHYWYHGVGRSEGKMSTLDMSIGVDEELRATAELDTYGVGAHFAQGYDFSLNFAGDARQNMGIVRLRVENPAVYGTGARSIGPDGLPIQPILNQFITGGQADVIYGALTGWKFSEGKRAFAVDIIERALRDGVTDPTEIVKLGQVFDERLSKQAIEAFTTKYPQYVAQGMEPIEAMGQALLETDFGKRALADRAFYLAGDETDFSFASAWDALPIDHPLRTANKDIADLGEWLENAPTKAAQQMKVDVLRATHELGGVEGLAPHFSYPIEIDATLRAVRPDNEFVASRFLWDHFFESAESRVRNTAMPGEYFGRLGKNFRESLEVDGFDGVVYASTDDATWMAAPLNPAQVERLRGEEALTAMSRVDSAEAMGDINQGIGDFHTPESMARVVKDVRDVLTDLRGSLARNQDELRATVDELGAKLDELPTADAATLQRQWFDNGVRLEQLERSILDAREPLRQDLQDALTEEWSWRTHADNLYAESQQLLKQVEDAEIQRANRLAAIGEVMEDTEKANKQARAYTLRLEAAAAKAEADLLKSGKRRLKAEAALTRLKKPNSLTKVEALVIPHGMSKLGWDKMAPSFIVDALSHSGKMLNEDGWMRPMLRMYDAALNSWKGWALATPGFHFRNTFGGVFNNWLAGIDMGRYKQYRRLMTPYLHAIRQGADEATARAAIRSAAKDGTEYEHMIQILESGLLTGGQSTDVILRSGNRASLNPLSPDNPITRASRVGVDIGKTGRHVPGGRDVENFLRGALALDTMAKTGGDLRATIDSVYKYHFDYEDLSRFERSVMRRVFPFYTWTRKNLPLQIEGMLENPKAYTRLMSVQRNMQVGVEAEQIVPNWFADTLTVDTGIEDNEGSRIYWMPDLPYKDLSRNASMRQILSQSSPFIKTPMEMWADKRFFQNVPFKEGYYQAPQSWERLGIPQILANMPVGPKAHKGSDGHWYMSEKDSYMVEQFVPLLGRARRIFPSSENKAGETGESKYEQRQLAFLISMNLGIGIRANTPRDQEIELWRRTQELEKERKLQTDLGYIERANR